jgi:hypothetical protein
VGNRLSAAACRRRQDEPEAARVYCMRVCARANDEISDYYYYYYSHRRRPHKLMTQNRLRRSRVSLKIETYFQFFFFFLYKPHEEIARNSFRANWLIVGQ